MDASNKRVAVIGGGPAGLMAAETVRAAGLEVDLYEANGSVGRRFLIAGKGGLNLTHSEPRPGFDARYRERAGAVGRWLDAFDAGALRDWARGLGVDSFVGSSGRVFPTDLKAAPLLRGWVRRLREQGVRFHVQHRFSGWDDTGALRFGTPDGDRFAVADATVLALGGGSWPELGGNTQWLAPLRKAGIEVAPLKPTNCGFDVAWSAFFADRFAGAPLKPVVAHWQGKALQGECVVSSHGIEGSLVYALSAKLRAAIERDGSATLYLDLAPNRELSRLEHDLGKPRNGRSASEFLRRQAGIEGVKAALLREVLDRPQLDDAHRLARTIKHFPLALLRPRPIEEAISSAGGVRLEQLDADLMLPPGSGGRTGKLFFAGEMLDWEAPTGGYLLTASFASGRVAGRGVVKQLA